VELAAFHVAMTLFATVAFALDALAIAAQALIGHRLGQGNREAARAILRRCLQWGLACGVVLGALLVIGNGWIGLLFSSDDAVHAGGAWPVGAAGGRGMGARRRSYRRGRHALPGLCRHFQPDGVRAAGGPGWPASPGWCRWAGVAYGRFCVRVFGRPPCFAGL